MKLTEAEKLRRKAERLKVKRMTLEAEQQRASDQLREQIAHPLQDQAAQAERVAKMREWLDKVATDLMNLPE